MLRRPRSATSSTTARSCTCGCGPSPRWQISLGAALASVGTALPLVVIPVTLAASLGAGRRHAVACGAAAAATVATIGYAGVFLALGFKVRRALVWGLAYILIWEGVPGPQRRLRRQAVGQRLRPLAAEPTSPRAISRTTRRPRSTAFIVPDRVAVVAIALTARWLQDDRGGVAVNAALAQTGGPTSLWTAGWALIGPGRRARR